ncbi:MAG TPA: ACP S-malonyltransferase [Bacillota bacterium]
MGAGFIFPGQGAQYVGMGKELCERYPSARAVFEEVNDSLGMDLAKVCFEGPEEALKQTVNTQPAILAVSAACLAVLVEQGVTPEAAAGLSLGEYGALVAADSLDLGDAVRLVQRRGRYMQEAVPEGRGTMAAILGLGRAEVEQACREASATGVVEPANYNCPGQVVIAGETAAVDRAVAMAKELGATRVVRLAVSAPFHCRLLRPAGERLAEDLEQVELKEAVIPVVANVSADYVRQPEDIKRCLIDQVSRPVRWEESVRRMVDDGVNLFVEVGPGKTLSGFLKRIVPEARTLNVEDGSSLEKLLDYWGEVC